MSATLRRSAGYRLLLSILLGLGLLAAAVEVMASQEVLKNLKSSEKQGAYTYITSTVSLPTGVARRPQSVAIDESLGLAYMADGDRGTVTLVNGPTFIDVIPVGHHVADVAVDSGTGFVYASVPDPYALYDGHVAVIQGGKVFTRVHVNGYPGASAVDRVNNRTYVSVETSLPYSDQVLILQQDHPIGYPSSSPGVVALAVDPARDRAYVLSKLYPSLTIVDGITKANEGTVQLEQLDVPRDVAVDSNSGLVYVVGQTGSESAGAVQVISDTQAISPTLAVGTDPRHVAVDPLRGWAYVTNAGDDTVTVISGTQVIETVPAGPEPDAIAVDPVGDRVYVSNAGDGTTTVLSGLEEVTTLPAGGGPLAVDTERGIAYLAGDGLGVAHNDGLLGRLPTAAMPARLAVNPENALVYVCNPGADTLAVLLDTDVVASLPLPGTPSEVAVDPMNGWVYVAQETALTVVQNASVRSTLPIVAHDVTVDPSRGLAYAAGDGVAVLRGTDLVDTIDVEQAPRRVAVDRASGQVYASAGGSKDGFVAIVSGTQRIGAVQVGATPDQLVVDPVRDRVFVLHPSQGRLSVIEGSRRRFPNVFLPRPPLDAVVNPLTGDLYVATRGPLVLVREAGEEVVDLGIEALAVAFDVKRGLVYATTRDGQVAVLDDADVVAMVPAGHRPLSLTVGSESGRAFVANYGSDSVTVIELQAVPPERRPDFFLPLIRMSGE